MTRTPERTRRPSRALVASVLLALALTGCSGGDEPARDVKLTTFKGQGFQVGYPSNWQRPAPDAALVKNAAFEAVDLSSGGVVPNAAVDVLQPQPASSLDQDLQQQLGVSYAGTPGFKETERKKVKVAGAAGAYRLRYSFNAPLPDGTTAALQGTALLARDNGRRVLNVRVICQVERCPGYEATIAAVLDSVRFTK